MIPDELFNAMVKANNNGTLKIRILDEPKEEVDRDGDVEVDEHGDAH